MAKKELKKNPEIPEEEAMGISQNTEGAGAGPMAEGENIIPEGETPMPEGAEAEESTEDQNNTLLVAVQEYYPDVTEATLNDMAVQTIQRLSGIQNKLIEAADEFPDFASMLNDILKGMPPDEAIARNFDESVLNPPEGAPDWDRINTGREERKKKKEEKNKRVKELKKNQEISVENTHKFIKESGLEEKDAQAFLEWYDKLNEDMFNGMISPEHLQALYKSYKHDSVVAEKDQEIEAANEAGRAAGRNEQIEKKKMNADTGDGIPKLSSGSKAAPGKKKSYAAKFIDGVI
jgi:hypothetical protein